MRTLTKLILALWAIVALIEMVIGQTDKAIFAICWAILIQLIVIENNI